MDIVIKEGYAYPDKIEKLFAEYTQMLIENDREFADYLVLQNYDDEIKHLEHKYGAPWGRLYIALDGDMSAGCIAMRKIDEDNCEMKRLYVRPEYRGRGLAKALVNKIILDAKNIGYKHILLDTLPFLKGAITLYKSLGFYEVESYNGSPMDNLIYLKFDI